MPVACSLHIGLNVVDPKHYSGWNGQLFGCENDALYYNEMAAKAGITDRKLLLSSFRPGSEMPTSANLEKYLDRYGKTLKSGDFLLITYSGHGGQIKDLNHEEEDVTDETWCLYDRQYLDDELWEHFNRFEKGVRVLIISDSCHSGSVSKGIDAPVDIKAEGSITDLFRETTLVSRNAPREITFAAYQAHKDEYYIPTHKPLVIKEDVGATVLLLGACREEEKASECNGFGLFTSTIRTTLMNSKDISSYEDWHQKILKQMPATQTPTLFVYGSGADLFRKEKIFQIGDAAPAGIILTGPLPGKNSVN